MLIHITESPKLVCKPQAIGYLPNLLPKLWNLYRQLDLHARRAKHYGRIRRGRDCGNIRSLVICTVFFARLQSTSRILRCIFVLLPYLNISFSAKRYSTNRISVSSGYGLGPMLFSPMSEIPRIGRSRIYFWTLFSFVLLQLPTGYSLNLEMFLVFRFLTGFFGGPVLATGGATIIDIYPPQDIPYWIGIFGACGILGPVFGPLIGGFAAQTKGWRWTIWELTWLCVVVLILLFFLMPETNPSNILHRRAQRIRKATGDTTFKSQSEMVKVSVKDNLVVLSRAFTLSFSEPIIFSVDLYTALLYGLLYLWFESFPLVFGDIYGFNIGQQGLVFLGIFVGGIITLPCYLFWITKHLIPQFSQKELVGPEVILPPTFFGAFALPICLFWYGWTARASIHWIVPLIGSGSFTISIITLFMPVLSYLGMTYPQYAASVMAGNTLFRASCGVVFPLFVSWVLLDLFPHS
jgi:DHA1 family multidrug resistance protein-like MFS transporter